LGLAERARSWTEQPSREIDAMMPVLDHAMELQAEG
jgi:hypothetical protein